MKDTMLLFATVLIVGLIQTQAEARNVCQGIPETANVLLPNPEDCGSYIQCDHEHPVVQYCQEGLHWSVSSGRCDWPYAAKCNVSKSSTTTSAPSFTVPIYNSNLNWTKCSGVPSNVDVLLPNPHDCGSYIQCVHQNPVVRLCPNGLHWSVAANRCEWPNIAKCNIANCSGVPSNVDVLLPNPKDCGSYIQCVHQKPVVRPCPSGLHWSVAAKRCEWPNIAKCKITLSTTTVPPPTTTTPSSKGNWTNCSGVPSNVDVLLPNPKDCGSYIQCVHHYPLIRNCTYGLHWNDKLKFCDLPENARCQKNQTTNSPWNSTKNPHNLTTTSVPPTNHSWSSCDGVPDYINVLLPNPQDCGSYIQCVHQKPLVRPCPTGLHWSVAANRCEWPNIAKCNIANCSGVPSNVDVLLPNPKDCGSYIQCVHQKPVVRPCPGGLHWSVAANRCEWPDIAGCENDIPA